MRESMEVNKTTHHGFDEFRNNLDRFSPELRSVQLRKGSAFLQLSMVSIKHHFKRYLSSLLFLSAATEPKAAVIICQYLLLLE